MRATPFRVDVPASQLDDLRRRLRTTRWADDFGNETWRYGVERGWLEEMVRYWAEEFDWRAQEAAINAFPQFRIELDGVPLHFVHVRGNGPSPTPLILTHGWPWTFWDWKDVIAPLADPAAHGGDPADAFDVVVPSLPGYGFSDAASHDGHRSAPRRASCGCSSWACSATSASPRPGATGARSSRRSSGTRTPSTCAACT